jgi:hypothetical protein
VIKREWQCPACQRVEWTGGQATAVACPCDPAKPVWMALIREPKTRPPSVLPKLDEPPLPS